MPETDAMLHPARLARCAFLLAACGVVPAAAQTDYRNLDEGRPLRTEDALPADHYGFELTLPYEMEARDGARLHLATPELAYGMIRGGEIGLALPLAAFDREPGTTWVLAGPQLFALQNLVRERPGLPTLTLRADLDLPLGGLGGAETALSLKAIGTRSWVRSGCTPTPR
jgi:hypothetical protein